MSQLSILYRAEPVRSLAAASVIAGYTAVGTALLHPIRQFFIENLTDATVMFSFDGVNDHLALPSEGFFLSDVTSNATIQGMSFALPQGTILYAKRIGVPTTGSIYFSAFYGSDF